VSLKETPGLFSNSEQGGGAARPVTHRKEAGYGLMGSQVDHDRSESSPHKAAGEGGNIQKRWVSRTDPKKPWPYAKIVRVSSGIRRDPGEKWG